MSMQWEGASQNVLNTCLLLFASSFLHRVSFFILLLDSFPAPSASHRSTVCTDFPCVSGWGFFLPLFSPARRFSVPVMSRFYASVTLTHPGGGSRTRSLFNKQPFLLKSALNSELKELKAGVSCWHGHWSPTGKTASNSLIYLFFWGVYSARPLFLLFWQVQLQINAPSHHKRLLRVPQLVWRKGMVPLGENRRRHCKFCSIYVDATEGNGVLGVRIEERLLENEQNKMIFLLATSQRGMDPRGQQKNWWRLWKGSFSSVSIRTC